MLASRNSRSGLKETVVKDLGVIDSDELVAQGTDFAVKGEALEIDVRAVTGLEADEAVLHDIDAADSMLAGEGVGGEEDACWLCHHLLGF